MAGNIAPLTSTLSELATQADEAGDALTSLALLHVIKASRLRPAMARRWVNLNSMLLETLEAAQRVPK
jgi:hypothetical protein